MDGRLRRQNGVAMWTAALAILGASTQACADHAPSYVVPGRLDVPVVINGVDASWSVVQGDWGLYRPGAPTTVELGTPVLLGPAPVGYFPHTGRRPRYGRHEILPRSVRRVSARPESFYRTWSTGPGAFPRAYPPDDPPPVIPAPRLQQ